MADINNTPATVKPGSIMQNFAAAVQGNLNLADLQESAFAALLAQANPAAPQPATSPIAVPPSRDGMNAPTPAQDDSQHASAPRTTEADNADDAHTAQTAADDRADQSAADAVRRRAAHRATDKAQSAQVMQDAKDAADTKDAVAATTVQAAIHLAVKAPVTAKPVQNVPSAMATDKQTAAAAVATSPVTKPVATAAQGEAKKSDKKADPATAAQTGQAAPDTNNVLAALANAGQGIPVVVTQAAMGQAASGHKTAKAGDDVMGDTFGGGLAASGGKQAQGATNGLAQAGNPDSALAGDANGNADTGAGTGGDTKPDPGLSAGKADVKSGGVADNAATTTKPSDFLSLFDADKAAPTTVAVPVVPVTTAVAGKVTPAGTATAGLQPAGAQGASASAVAGLTAQSAPVPGGAFANQLTAAQVAKLAPPAAPSPVEQVIVQLRKQVKDGNDQITIQMNPEDLGKVEVKLTFTEGNKVQATIIADHQATLDLLAKDAGGIQQALQDAGLHADSGSLQFSLRGDGQPGFAFSQNNNGSSHQAATTQIYANAHADTADTTSDGGSNGGEVYYLNPNRVNLRV